MTIATPISRLGALLLDIAVPVACLIVVVLGFSSMAAASGGAPDSNAALLGAALLVLAFASLGYFIWALILYGSGQSPGKFLMGLRVVRLDQGKAAGFGTMLLREMVAKPVINILGWITGGIVNFWLVWDKDTQELWDKVVGTIVVNDAHKLTVT